MPNAEPQESGSVNNSFQDTLPPTSCVETGLVVHHRQRFQLGGLLGLPQRGHWGKWPTVTERGWHVVACSNACPLGSKVGLAATSIISTVCKDCSKVRIARFLGQSPLPIVAVSSQTSPFDKVDVTVSACVCVFALSLSSWTDMRMYSLSGFGGVVMADQG